MECYVLSAFTCINNLFSPHNNYRKNVNYHLHFYQLGH